MRALHIALLILLAALSLPAPASARHPRGLQVTGMIVSVDHSTRTITLEEAHGKGFRRFVYVARSRFWDGASEAPLRALKPGMRVEITLHDPVFGPDYATRILQLPSAPPSHIGV